MRALWSAGVMRSWKTSRAKPSRSSEKLVVAPGLAHQALCAGAVALQQQRAGERELSLRGGGSFLGEERAHESRIETVRPQAWPQRGGAASRRLGQLGLSLMKAI